MNKQRRQDLILFVALLIFLFLYVLTNSFWWPFITIFASAFIFNSILDRAYPLKKGPKMIWWKELVYTMTLFIICLFIIKWQMDEPLISQSSLIQLIGFTFGCSLGILTRHINQE